jgi:hypothetical protein
MACPLSAVRKPLLWELMDDNPNLMVALCCAPSCQVFANVLELFADSCRTRTLQLFSSYRPSDQPRSRIFHWI